ncbi:MAG: cyclic beta 1-2 glucan synthetase, partial [Planctomycetaceae bacterium]|nr:cyclic beta 1-2 glucan synthetase [Planctomycetaceae bacterium]
MSLFPDLSRERSNGAAPVDSPVGQPPSRWRFFRRGHSTKQLEPQVASEQPLRGELFSLDQLERFAREIAGTHRIDPRRGRDQMLPRLQQNQRELLRTYDQVALAAARNQHIEPAAEWLLDNFYVVEEQIRAIRRLLPPSFSRELPRLANGPAPGLPRVYALCIELIAHVDGRVDEAILNAFVASYQSVTPLKLGELWALPLMLRLALIENLRRVAVRVAAARCDRDLAADWARQMVQVVERNPTDLVLVLADMRRANPPLSGAFVSELSRQLQGQNPNFAFANSWLEQRLTDHGLSSEQLVREESQIQAADQVSMGNSINSLRFVSSNDWREFVGAQSVVEKTLAGDPAAVYSRMDFATRDRYRHAVEGIARRSRWSEYDVARKAVQLAENEAREHPDGRSAHVGYFLVDHGRWALESLAEMRLTPVVILDKLRRRLPLTCYLGSIVVVTGLATWGFLRGLEPAASPPWIIWLLATCALLAASNLGVGIINLLVSRLVRPQALPRMDFEHGIPGEHGTLVVVPTMLTSPAGVEHLIEGLELRYLANRDPHLHFALLTDFCDAHTEVQTQDAELVKVATEGICQLNRKYASSPEDIFFLFHRARRWNPQEGVWMGRERKRGKLADLNAMLRGATGRFAVATGDTSVLQRVRYVITLDTDTQLPRDAARCMVGTLAHPLNRPVSDPQGRRIVAGYTILQPRVGSNLTSLRRSRFSLLQADDAGIDPYTQVVSDVYQDMFGEGSFIGKGIYDVDSFERFCGNFPENTILSHDLIEGAYGRSGLLTDVTLYEEHPSRYLADVERRHRWMRGDWQIAGWLLPRVRSRTGERCSNPVSALSRWKILDNLRRSVTPIAAFVLLLAAWCTSADAALAATLLVIAAALLPVLVSGILQLLSKPADLPTRLHERAVAESMLRPVANGILSLIWLPFEAYTSTDAIVRTLIRMCVTRRRLLEWRTASEAERAARGDLHAAYRTMAAAPMLAMLTLCLLLVLRPGTISLAAPFLAAWALSPVLAWWISRPLRVRPTQLTASQQLFLNKLSRLTYRYFEEFVTAEHSWLPPDNIQHNPMLTVAPRTSPTNIGMALLSDLAACDFGFCSVAQLLGRTEKTLDTISRMERHHGHLLNWYDTGTLAPLHPRYVSTVDSGNLAACLLVLSSGYRELATAPLLPPRMFAGIATTLQVLLDVVRGNEEIAGGADVVRKIERELDVLQSLPSGLRAARALLARLSAVAAELAAIEDDDQEIAWWLHAYKTACDEHLEDILHLAPWLNAPAGPGASDDVPALLLKPIRLIMDELDNSATLASTILCPARLKPLLDAALPGSTDAGRQWLEHLFGLVATGAEHAEERSQASHDMAQRCRDLAEMDFGLLYDRKRELFTIGYNVSDQRLDASFYDLLASEARLASYLAVASGEVGQQHWFALGRMLTNAANSAALLSWSGSMFEYLMPLLVMPSYEATLLDRTYNAVVRRQIEYGRQRRVPWGISESGYNLIDQHRTYQYRAFGVPGLGLKRGLGDDLVIAPYATALALMVTPEAACRNLERLAGEGQLSDYGFCEAIDYTTGRLPPGALRVTVRQYMAHHHGMTLLSLARLLLNQPMQRRFMADPMLRAAELLLQERVPKAIAPVFPHAIEAQATRTVSAEESGSLRAFADPSRPNIELHLLSNGRYHVAITTAGGGYSKWRDLAVTRWREDPTRDAFGSFCYLRDVTSGAVWSNTWQPTLQEARQYEAIFSQARAEFRRVDNQI